MQPRIVVFDLGGVLIDWNPRYLYRQLFASEAEMEHFLTHIATPDWNEEQDGGRPLEEATQWLLEQHPEYAPEIRAFYGRWPEMLGGPIPETVALLRDLKADGRYPLYALTNWSAETWPIALERFDFLHWFDGILVSGAEKMRKPDPAFYQRLANRFGFNLADSLFIDDNARNLAAAANLGMRTVHFTGPEQCEPLRKILLE
jgi:2-haloacid dehalogenase